MQSTLLAQSEFNDFHTKRESGEVDVVARFSIDGEPVSKARARFTKRGSKVVTYTPEKTKTAEHEMAKAFKEAAAEHVMDPVAAFGVSCVFINGTRQRRDVDNMIKLVLDGLNGVAWKDDNQVSEVSGRKEYVKAKSDSKTHVIIYRIGKHYRRTKPCLHCGTEFDVFDSTEDVARFCSAACVAGWRSAKMDRTCERCGDPFRTASTGSAQRFCSRPCAYASKRVDVNCDHCGMAFNKQQCHVRDVNYCAGACSKAASVKKLKAAGWRAGDCQECGGPVTRKEYKRCNPCRMGAGKATGKPRPIS
jgi:Holliday junction resolvase RusA-like endonuclease